MWKTEKDNENRVRYARHVDAVKAARSEVDRIAAWLRPDRYPGVLPVPGAWPAPHPVR